MRILYQNSNGGCSVVVPASDSELTLEKVIAKSVPAGTPYKVVQDSEIPADRTYRDAWVPDLIDGKVTHDMTKAREIHKGFMRRARASLLTALDVAYMRADENGAAGNAEKAMIAAKKQALRDVTADPGIAAAQTVDELKQVWPAILRDNPL